jgi:ribosomal protein L29
MPGEVGGASDEVERQAARAAREDRGRPAPARELADQLFALRLQKTTGQLEKPSKIREAKRELARVLTVLREKRKSG